MNFQAKENADKNSVKHLKWKYVYSNDVRLLYARLARGLVYARVGFRRFFHNGLVSMIFAWNSKRKQVSSSTKANIINIIIDHIINKLAYLVDLLGFLLVKYSMLSRFGPKRTSQQIIYFKILLLWIRMRWREPMYDTIAT